MKMSRMKQKQKNKIRKSTKYTLIIVSIIIFIFSCTNLSKNLSNESMKITTKEIYNYTNKFKYDYKINMIKNKYIKEEQQTDKSLAYVTDLIDTIDLSLNYDYIASKQTDIDYTYTIIGKTKVVYTKDGKEQKIIDEEEIIKEEQKAKVNSSKLNINENLVVDVKEKNNLLAEFKQKMGMAIDAKYEIYLKIKTKTQIEGENVEVEYAPCVEIDLAEKTTEILGEKEKDDTKFISKEYQINTAKNKVSIIINGVLFVIAALILKYVSQFRTANRVKDEFRLELNRILKICRDKIVQVNTRPSDNGDNLVVVKDFGEIVKVSEELFKPILYYFDNEKQEAWFSVMTGTITYRYILKE